MIYLFFFVKLEILKQPYSNMHALSFFFLSRISCYFFFFKKALIMVFQKEKKKKGKKNPLLLYATAKLGEMALAYLKGVCFKKKKACLGSHCDSAKYIYVHPSYKNTNMLAFREACWFSGKKILEDSEIAAPKDSLFSFLFLRTTKRVFFFFSQLLEKYH